MPAKTVHSMIRVLDEARSVDFYQSAFGLDVADRYDFEGFTLVYLSNPQSPFEVELTINKDRTEPYQMGDGYGHLAVVVDDVDAEHARLTAAGMMATPLRDFEHAGQLLGRFFFLTDPDGYKIEVIRKAGRFG